METCPFCGSTEYSGSGLARHRGICKKKDNVAKRVIKKIGSALKKKSPSPLDSSPGRTDNQGSTSNAGPSRFRGSYDDENVLAFFDVFIIARVLI